MMSRLITKTSRILLFVCATDIVALSIALAWQHTHLHRFFLGDPRLAEVFLALLTLFTVILALRALRAQPSVWAWWALSAVTAGAWGSIASYAIIQRRYHDQVDTNRVSAVARLRMLGAAEEEWRLEHGTYTTEIRALGIATSANERIDVEADGSKGYTAVITGTSAKLTCRLSVSPHNDERPTLDMGPSCDGDRMRVILAGEARAPTADGDAPASIQSQWLQHLHDAGRSTRCCNGGQANGWRINIGSPIRATPSIAQPLVLVGAHGSGEIVAVDSRNGRLVWHTRAPNWVHNDVLVSGHIAVVGFGNSEAGGDLDRLGSPPSGVLALDVVTGRRLWIHYANNAVMTAPVIWGNTVVFVPADGEATALDISSGNVTWTTRLPTRVAMANPAVLDSTLYVTGDPSFACAVDIRNGRKRWCRFVSPNLTMGGHASAAVKDNTLIMTGLEDSTAWQFIRGGHWGTVGHDLFDLARVGSRPNHQGAQFAVGLDANTGDKLWEVSLGSGHIPTGHVAGTAVIRAGVAYVLSSIGETITAVDARSGRVRWQKRTLGATRGAVTLIDDAIAVLHQDGALQVLSAETGDTRCTGKFGIPSDRGSMAISGGTAYASGTDGTLAAIPISEILRCER